MPRISSGIDVVDPSDAPTLTSLTDEELLIAFDEGDSDALGELARRYNQRFSKIVGHRDPDLRDLNLVEDVVQQLWLILIRRKTSGFNPALGTACSYLEAILVRDAIRDVRALHARVGQRTRFQATSGSGENQGSRRPFPVSLDQHREGDDEGYSLLETISDSSAEDALTRVEERADATIQVERIFIIADQSASRPSEGASVREALQLIYEHAQSHRTDVTMRDVAKQLGVDRTTIARRIARLVSQLPIAKAA